MEAKLFATLLHLVDSINMQPSGNKIFIIGMSAFSIRSIPFAVTGGPKANKLPYISHFLALTNRLHAVDSSLMRSGRLDKVYDLHLKGVDQRLGALRILSKGIVHSFEVNCRTLAFSEVCTHCYLLFSFLTW